MKTYLLALCLLFISANLIAQTDYGFGNTKSLAEKQKYKKTLEKKAKAIKSKILKEDSYQNKFQKEINADFAVDTFYIEKLYEFAVSETGSCSAMADENYLRGSEYEKLLNKYYKVLMGLLSAKSKELLKNSQKKWLEYRDSEKKFNDNFYWDAGEGTLQYVWISYRTVEITKTRVIEIVDYLSRDGFNNESE